MRKLFFIALLACLTTAAFGQAVIATSTGNMILGVQQNGQLDVSPGTNGYTTANGGASGAVGLAYRETNPAYGVGNYYDATSPGCLCEGWGAAGNGISGYANTDSGGTSNVSNVSFSASSTNIVSVTTIDGSGLQVSQDYHVSTGAPTALFEDVVTLTNTTGALMTDVRYTRVMDWDVPHTEFNEFVTLQGWGATNLLRMGNNGFDSGDPFSGALARPSCPANTNLVDCGPDDHGAIFHFGFGDLAAGQSVTFSIFYGYAGNERDAIIALAAVGAEVYSLGQQNIGGPVNDGNTFMFAFKGVGGTPVTSPEPAALVLLGSGILAVSRRKLRR